MTQRLSFRQLPHRITRDAWWLADPLKPAAGAAGHASARRFALAVALCGAADWLFYGREIGISLPLFLVAVGGAAILANGRYPERRRLQIAIGSLALALLPSTEDFGFLSAAFGTTGLAFAVLIATRQVPWQLEYVAAAILRLLTPAPRRLVLATLRSGRKAWACAAHGIGRSWFIAWIVPASVGLTFAILFAAANPLIDMWLLDIELWPLVAWINGWRLAFWLCVASPVWPFLRIRLRRRKPQRRYRMGVSGVAFVDPARQAMLFGETAILRSLLLFNALFAVQSVLDIAYLWGGVALPNGMTYASYAHRGAYPLIVTALLAGAFVLAAMRPGSASERSPLIRGLVYLWVGQNVLLVLSSILRLDLYVEVYALTELRVAAFIWMGLVAAGLVLIVLRIVLLRSDRWLIAANAATLTATLYVCAFIDFTALIADYNVAHSREVTGQGQPIDAGYLCRLGPGALPAAYRLLEAPAKLAPYNETALRQCIQWLEGRHREDMADWRAWGFRGERLLSLLNERRAMRLTSPP